MLDVAKPALLGGQPVFEPSLPMARPQLPSADALLPDFRRILESGQLTKGEHLAGFETESEAYLGVNSCVGVSSCTSGLMLCLQALKRRLKSGQEHKVAVPSFTFLASITALVWAGFTPVFVEADPATMNIDLEDLEQVLKTEAPCAVLAVHCFGNPVPTDTLQSLCDRFDARLMIDAAHGFGSLYQGEKVGKAGWCQVFSLTPTKMVVAGEGGIIATQDYELAEELRIAREYGNDGSYDTQFSGLNARLSELHSCLARGSLKMLESVVAHRNQVAEDSRRLMEGIPGLRFQSITPQSRTTYKDLTLVVEQEQFGLTRDRLAEALQAEGIPSRKYFSPPCHRHKAFKEFASRELPQTEKLADGCLSIPLLDTPTAQGIARAFRKIRQFSKQIQAGTS